MTSQGPLTAWLLSATPDALQRATTHPFLASAGRGTLPKQTLSQWLSQDRLYAQSYIRFIGHLLTKIRLDSTSTATSALSRQAANVLIDALVNIRTELLFFESTAAAYGLDLTAISAEDGGGSTGSTAINASAGISTTGSASCPGTGGGTGSGAVEDPAATPSTVEPVQGEGAQRHRLCGAQGECQVQARSEEARGVEDGKVDADGGALREKFIPNWSSDEFEGFVNQIGDVLDALAGQIKGAEESELMRARCLEWWRQVVWLEERFWPPMD
ncbi:heme oxygenase-like multi-helical [Penicillium chermesinum]|uniref:Heme oxygenase-like multi-helical n=1 Tax=Penicillium chermesinum TaxID=63820 RepID=A0A9W9P9E8_9EURO|nr:heme oxygenase-like multi-helical [Penicillium chermesinum]KAJ5239936.1 heme oxygenase-like multi-helical [Penicillium chermesinum]